MAGSDYPIDVRVNPQERSSRAWAALTILLIKFLALMPHFFCLVFLGIAVAIGVGHHLTEFRYVGF